MSEIAPVRVIEAIKPVNAATGDERLIYDGLTSAIQHYRDDETARLARVWDSQPSSLEELSAAQQLASQYLLENAGKQNTAPSQESQDLWADRYTQASVELYGGPDASDAYVLLRTERDTLAALKDNRHVSQTHLNFLMSTYDEVIENAAKNGAVVNPEQLTANETAEREAIRRYGAAIRDKYQPVFDLVDPNKSEYRPDDLQILFTDALNWLTKNEDEAWTGWQALMTDRTSLSVSAHARQINIARGREPVTPQGATALLAHELLVHALRGKNGAKSGIEHLGTGLAGYGAAEEGLGILSEQAVIGDLSDKANDRYLDIALALGTIDGKQRSRRELFEISFARSMITAQLKNTDKTRDSLTRTTWRHIDRIYRGGRGDSPGHHQAIYTKDISYYVGYKQMAQYITQQLAAGSTPESILEYVSRGKFDPTNPKHVAHMNAS